MAFLDTVLGRCASLRREISIEKLGLWRMSGHLEPNGLNTRLLWVEPLRVIKDEASRLGVGVLSETFLNQFLCAR